MLSNVSFCEIFRILAKSSGAVDGNIPHADDRHSFRSKIKLVMTVVRMSVVPSNKLCSCVTSFESLPNDVQMSICAATKSVNHCVIALKQVKPLDVFAKFYISKKSESWVSGCSFKNLCDRLYFLMIWSNSTTY